MTHPTTFTTTSGRNFTGYALPDGDFMLEHMRPSGIRDAGSMFPFDPSVIMGALVAAYGIARVVQMASAFAPALAPAVRMVALVA